MKLRHILAILAATALTFSFVYVRLHIVSTSYELNELAKTEKELREDCNELSMKISATKSPAKLERLAVQKFKMQSPRADQIINLGK